MSNKVIIFKNDRIGDLVSSVPAINLIIEQNINNNLSF